MKDNKMYDSSWETGECTDKSVIYLNIKGMLDKRFSHLHMKKSDVQLLINDLQSLIDNKNERVHLKITKK